MSPSHKEPWQALKKTYERKGIVLVLGAGVSVKSGIHSWDELLARLARKTVTGKEIFDQLRSRGFSQTAITSALEQLYGSRETFIQEVRKVLYGSLNMANMCVNNRTLRAVAAFCCSFANGYRPNPKIPCVVSFNLDSLLETFTELRYGRLFMRTIDHAAVSSTPRSLSVYHVHGYIPIPSTRRDTEALTNIVLTERDYFDFFGNPLGVFTYTFLHLLHEHSCLFIGLSMRDDNIRRLLHYSARERRSASTVLANASKADNMTRRHYAIIARGDNSTDQIIEDGLLNLGVRALWLDDYDQLPDRLAYVYGVYGNSWGAVYSEHNDKTADSSEGDQSNAGV